MRKKLIENNYEVFYNNKTYGNNKSNKGKLFTSMNNTTKAFINTVPSIIDSNLELFEDNDNIILVQKNTIFDIKDQKESFYEEYKESIFNITDKKFVKYDINENVIFERLSHHDDLRMSTFSIFFFNILEKINVDLANDILDNINFSSMGAVNIRLEKIKLLIENIQYLEAFNELLNSNKRDITIHKFIKDEDFETFLINEIKNVDNMPNCLIEFIQEEEDLLEELDNIKDLKLNEEDAELFISFYHAVNRYQTFYSRTITNYLYGLKILLNENYKLRDIYNYAIESNYVLEQHSNIFDFIYNFGKYVEHLKEQGINNFIKYPENLTNTISIIKHNQIALENFLETFADQLTKTYDSEESKATRTKDLLSISSKIKNSNNLLKKQFSNDFKEFNVIEIASIEDVINNLYARAPINTICNKGLLENNFIYFIEDTNNIATIIIDKNFKIVAKYYEFNDDKGLILQSKMKNL